MTLPDGYSISAEQALLDLDVIHGFIAQSYWARAIPKATVERMIRHSLCFGVYFQGGQVGFARVISDYTTFAYLADVFILPPHRGKGLSKILVKTILAHPELQGLRRWMLITADAQTLYASFGFRTIEHPERHMEIHLPAMYVPAEGNDS
jgi:N-acetylglutamate synthase-like GNAT family acetyltransferase